MALQSPRGALVVFGSGPGIGRHIASHFASKGFHHVVLLSRNASRLQDDAAEVTATEPRAIVHTVTADVSSATHLKEALAQVDEKLRGHAIDVETVLFNAARVGESEVLKFSAEELEDDFKISVSSLYTVAQWIIPRLVRLAQDGDKASYRPSLLVTGGFLHRDPYPPLFSLSAVKAAQYNLVCTLHKVFKSSGVHCAMILVGGFVSAEAQQCNPKNIAEKAWDLYEQGPDVREIEIVEPDWERRTKWCH
ncbi:Short-chain alcohol protein [Neofusicoccum parvum]|nr:Short-chain alcohol protein [Neofusicoccum parvum]